MAAVGSTQGAAREPTDKWTVNFDDAQCVASRAYGSAEEPLFLAFKAPPVGDVIQITVIRNGSFARPDQVDASISVDDRRPLHTNMLMYGQKDQKIRVYMINMSSADFSPLRQAKSVTIRSSGLNETFSLTQISPVLKLLQDCVADLRKVWNVGDQLAEQSPLPQRASTKDGLAAFVSDSDYPDVAVRKDQSGAVRYAILINEAGKVVDCTVIETSGVAALDAQTCWVMKSRATFEPARGSDGSRLKM